MYDLIINIGTTTTQHYLIDKSKNEILQTGQILIGSSGNGEKFWDILPHQVEKLCDVKNIYLSGSIGYLIHNLSKSNPDVAVLKNWMIQMSYPYIPVNVLRNDIQTSLKTNSIIKYAPDNIVLELRGNDETPWKSTAGNWCTSVSQILNRTVFDIGGGSVRRCDKETHEITKFKHIKSNNLSAEELAEEMSRLVEPGDILLQTGNFRDKYSEFGFDSVKECMRKKGIESYYFLPKACEGPLEAYDFARVSGMKPYILPNHVASFVRNLK